MFIFAVLILRLPTATGHPRLGLFLFFFSYYQLAFPPSPSRLCNLAPLCISSHLKLQPPDSPIVLLIPTSLFL